ncbi:hypothetical protein [Streptomyces europaeiscabiei]|uniref:hypothetical protein n=1 Tax=Streptomyces europaeiscabiei TaxID=146819 RepID=UPI0029B8432C|nr:hypothetical protein [Streptomyces europaeiscabiei]MDX3839850.1 hypothetical protein [Streptomyces europaeiscabiei]
MPAIYLVEFGPAWPIPPIAVDYSDPDTAEREIAAHAIPHLKPLLAARARPELADCFFHPNRDLTAGQFLWLDLAGREGARFCPARLTPTRPAA